MPATRAPARTPKAPTAGRFPGARRGGSRGTGTSGFLDVPATRGQNRALSCGAGSNASDGLRAGGELLGAFTRLIKQEDGTGEKGDAVREAVGSRA